MSSERPNIPLVTGVTEDNFAYLQAKRDKAGHIIGSDEELRSLMAH
ncbi:MAG TPA: hypothetical protein VF189_03515 [Patescibacteria group bacterium]